MKFTTSIAAITAASALSATAAFADGHANGHAGDHGYYIQGSLGFNQLSDTDQSGAPGTVASDYDGGYNISVAVGKKLSSLGGLRAELELSYSDNDADTIDFSGNGVGNEGNVDGDISSTSLYANVLYDIETAGKITPYIGAGLGVSFIDSSIAYGGAPVRIDDSDTAFSAQLIAGAAYELSETLDLTFDARYSRAFNVGLDRATPAGTAVVEDDFDNLSLNLGLRFKF